MANDSYLKIIGLRIMPGVAVGLAVSAELYAVAAGMALAYILLALGERSEPSSGGSNGAT